MSCLPRRVTSGWFSAVLSQYILEIPLWSKTIKIILKKRSANSVKTNTSQKVYSLSSSSGKTYNTTDHASQANHCLHSVGEKKSMTGKYRMWNEKRKVYVTQSLISHTIPNQPYLVRLRRAGLLQQNLWFVLEPVHDQTREPVPSVCDDEEDDLFYSASPLGSLRWPHPA